MKFLLDISDKESVYSILTLYLREYGIRVPKLKRSPDKKSEKATSKVFGNFLYQIDNVETKDGLQIPRFLDEAVYVIRENITTEGLFRRTGSLLRQKQLKECVEKGGSVNGCHVLDVANLVKLFFRELPEPLFPSKMNDVFLKAYQLESEYCRENAVLMLCALLPRENLQILRYFMLFLSDIASQSAKNKMDASNLALIITPNVMPMAEKTEKWDKLAGKLFNQQMGIVKLLIENSRRIGMISDSVLERVETRRQNQSADEDQDNCCRDRPRKNSRKSLTGVIRGLRTMVQTRSVSSYPADDQNDQSPNNGTAKRKPDADPEDASAPKKISPDFYKNAMMPSAQFLRDSATLMMDLPVASVNHFDSPNPAGFGEDVVSLTPSRNRQCSGRRKSKRGNIISRAYLKRRSHTFLTPKSAKKPESKKKDFLSPMSCVRSESTSSRRLSCDVPLKSPVEELIDKSRQALNFSYSQKTEIPPKAKSAIDMVRNLSQVAISIGVNEYKPNRDKTPEAAEAIPKPKLPRTRSYTEGSRPVEPQLIGKLEPAKDTLTVSPARTKGPKLESCVSLRRGRPNSVRTGLVQPSVLKLYNGDDLEDGESTPVNLETFLPEEFREELTAASRQSVFGSPDRRVKVEEPFLRKSPSIDSGVGKSMLDVTVDVTVRKSVSLTSLMVQMAAFGQSEWHAADDVFETGDRDAVFATPVVPGRNRSKMPEPLSSGRPSLLMLMNEKKGTVSANVKRFNDISKAVPSSGPLTPIQLTGTPGSKCRSLDVPKMQKTKVRHADKRENVRLDANEGRSTPRKRRSATPKSEGKKRKMAMTASNTSSPSKPVRM